MELRVYNVEGNDTGRTVVVSDELFGTEPNDHVLWLAVKQYLADQRQGTHKSKERSEVSGSTRKLKRQKGTGGARAGEYCHKCHRLHPHNGSFSQPGVHGGDHGTRSGLADTERRHGRRSRYYSDSGDPL